MLTLHGRYRYNQHMSHPAGPRGLVEGVVERTNVRKRAASTAEHTQRRVCEGFSLSGLAEENSGAGVSVSNV